MTIRSILKLLAMGLAVPFLFSCATTPVVQPEPPSKVTLPREPLPDVVLKAHHAAMGQEMSKAYDQADEILLGLHTGSFVDETNGLIYFFENFQTFDKATLTWGPVMEVIVQVLPRTPVPEIITQREFKSMITMDKVGICWDAYEGKRYVYLIEGENMLLFLDLVFDEVTTNSYRYLIDSYPATRACDAISRVRSDDKGSLCEQVRQHYTAQFSWQPFLLS